MIPVQTTGLRFSVWISLVVIGATIGGSQVGFGFQAPAANPTEKMDGPAIERGQQQLTEKYRLLEEKLYALYQFESDKNPTRSKLLQRAFQRSQESATLDRLAAASNLLTAAKLKQAESEQAAALEHLNQLLALLQSEDRGKRIRDSLERHQEYLKEIERLLRIQKSLRGQTEGGVDSQRIAQSESQAADRAKKLADLIRDQEEVSADDESDDDSSETDASQNSPSKKNNDTPPGRSPESTPPAGEGNDTNHSAESPPVQQSGGDSAETSSANPPNPIRKRIDAAQDQMRRAQQKLQEARRDDATEAMKVAEKEMAEAKKQLEEVLRQLREEEIERTLAKLEGRFRKMLERQIKIKKSTERLGAIQRPQQGTDFEIETGKLAAEENSIATDAGRALLVLKEDGSSVAFPQTVDEMQQDMKQIAARLTAAKVGDVTIDLQDDVIETLNYLVDALAKAQKENAKSAQNPRRGGDAQPQSPGDEALVGQIAELKMLRSLQDRIHRRHQRYAASLENPDDPVGAVSDPELKLALGRLAEKQRKLTKIALDIVNEIGN